MKVSALFANKRTRVIVTVAAVVLVLAILTPILLYAGGYIMPFDADGTPSARLLDRIERDYGRDYFGWYYASAIHGKIGIQDASYGTYNGCVPVMLALPAYTVIGTETVADIVFYYSDSNRIRVWHEGDFYSMQEAYDRGLLSYENLRAIAEIKNSGYQDFGLFE